MADDEGGAAEMILSGTNHRKSFGKAATGRFESYRAAATMRFRHGRISEWRDYYARDGR